MSKHHKHSPTHSHEHSALIPVLVLDIDGVLLLRDVGREHLGELLVLQAAAQELVFRQVSVAVLQGRGKIGWVEQLSISCVAS